MNINKNDLELLRYGFTSFKFIIGRNMNLSFTKFANIINDHSSSIQANEVSNAYRKYKGIVSRKELIINCI